MTLDEARQLKPGDLLVVVTSASGRWGEKVRFERIDADGMVQVTLVNDADTLYSASPDVLRVPRVVGACSEDRVEPPAKAEPKRGRSRGERITDAQRRKLFAVAKSRGLDLEAVRDLTPAGSVSMLTRAQAHDLIDRLAGRPTAPHQVYADQGGASGRQLGLIAHLAAQIGFTDAEFSSWMGKRFGVESIAQVADGGLANRIVGGMKRMLAARQRVRGTG